jgi:D-tyrosyl-tRNA(Tyr) deacylase
MRAVLQRVSSASVAVAGIERAAIGRGLLVLLGIEQGDEEADVQYLSGKVARLRIFADQRGLMNASAIDLKAEALVVSQFTLIAETAKGNRPSFMGAARGEVAEPLYQAFIGALAAQLGRAVPSGVFGADMQVSLVNDGPVTLVLDSRRPA